MKHASPREQHEWSIIVPPSQRHVTAEVVTRSSRHQQHRSVSFEQGRMDGLPTGPVLTVHRLADYQEIRRRTSRSNDIGGNSLHISQMRNAIGMPHPTVKNLGKANRPRLFSRPNSVLLLFRQNFFTGEERCERRRSDDQCVYHGIILEFRETSGRTEQNGCRIQPIEYCEDHAGHGLISSTRLMRTGATYSAEMMKPPLAGRVCAEVRSADQMPPAARTQFWTPRLTSATRGQETPRLGEVDAGVGAAMPLDRPRFGRIGGGGRERR